MASLCFKGLTWLVFVAGAYYYAAIMRHPARRTLGAFLLFLGVAEGVTLASVAGATTLLGSLGSDGALAPALSQGVPVAAIGVIALGFLYARHLIRRPPRAAG